MIIGTATHTRILSEPPHFGAFLLRGEGVANGNQWNPLPRYVESESIPFQDWQSWNQKADAMNTRYQSFLRTDE